MVMFQTFNGMAWVKYDKKKDGSVFKDVKQREPTQPFKNVPIRAKRRS